MTLDFQTVSDLRAIFGLGVAALAVIAIAVALIKAKSRADHAELERRADVAQKAADDHAAKM